MGEYEDRQKIREQRQGLLDQLNGSTAGADTRILPSENGGEPEAGRNDGSEAGGVAPVGGVIDLESARQQYKGLTGQVASAKWSAEEIAEKIAQWRQENERLPAGEGEGTGQNGPLTTEDVKKSEEALAAEAAAREAAEKSAGKEATKDDKSAAKK